MFKTISIATISMAMGVAVGLAATSWEFSRSGNHWVESLNADKNSSVAGGNTTAQSGKVTVVNGESFDFGVMERFTKSNHTFELKNEGLGELTIGLLQTSCTCATSDLQEGESVVLHPGEVKGLTLEWEIKDESRKFVQSATLRTSDPNQPLLQLTIGGRVSSVLRLAPESIVFSDVSNKESKSRLLRVFSYQSDDLNCTHVEQISPELEEFFDVEVRQMEAAEVAEEDDCKSGLVVRVTAKPGMPLGPFRQNVRLATNLESHPSLEFEVEGNVEGDISIWTQERYSQRKRILDLGLIKQRTRKFVEVQVMVKGAYKDTIEVLVDKQATDPSDVLRASLGKPVAMGKLAKRFPLTIEVDAGDHAVSRLHRADKDNYGRVVLKTTHPDAPQIVIRVSFATGG